MCRKRSFRYIWSRILHQKNQLKLFYTPSRPIRHCEVRSSQGKHHHIRLDSRLRGNDKVCGNDENSNHPSSRGNWGDKLCNHQLSFPRRRESSRLQSMKLDSCLHGNDNDEQGFCLTSPLPKRCKTVRRLSHNIYYGRTIFTDIASNCGIYFIYVTV